MAASLLVGCNRQAQPPSLGGKEHAFDPVAFFDGHVHSWGVVESRSGAPTEWVTTDCQGHIDGSDRLNMVQHLSFQDGTKQDRTWTMRRLGPQRFEATANDMVGHAIGESKGGTFHWQWKLARDPGNKLLDVTMEQWMYQLDDGSVLVRSTINKLGVILAEVTEQFTHAATARTADAPAANPAKEPG